MRETEREDLADVRIPVRTLLGDGKLRLLDLGIP